MFWPVEPVVVFYPIQKIPKTPRHQGATECSSRLYWPGRVECLRPAFGQSCRVKQSLISVVSWTLIRRSLRANLVVKSLKWVPEKIISPAAQLFSGFARLFLRCGRLRRQVSGGLTKSMTKSSARELVQSWCKVGASAR